MAAQFDAATDRVSRTGSVPDPATACTVLGWVRMDADTNASATLARIWTAALGTVATFATDSGGLAGPNYFTSGGSVISPTVFVVGQWWRFAFACAGTSAAVYAGPEGGAVTATTGTVTGQTPPGGITLGGRDTSDASENMVGSLAYVRVFPAKLTQAQAEEEWESATAVNSPWADWPLTADLNDISGNGRHLVAGSTAVAWVAGPTPPAAAATAVLAGTLPSPSWAGAAEVTAEAELLGVLPALTGHFELAEQLPATAVLLAELPPLRGGTPVLPFGTTNVELYYQRLATHNFILASPVEVALVPNEEVRMPSGAREMVAQAPRASQTFRLIPMSHTERPASSSSGDSGGDVQRKYDMTLYGEWDAVVRENDSWTDENGQTYVVDAVIPWNGYQVKGLVMSYGRRGSIV